MENETLLKRNTIFFLFPFRKFNENLKFVICILKAVVASAYRDSYCKVIFPINCIYRQNYVPEGGKIFEFFRGQCEGKVRNNLSV